MAATGFTPISLYYSTTASAVPSAGNLANGELALNIADMKLYAKNSSGTVTLLASNASTTGVDSLSFGSTGLTPSTATTGAITVAGTLNVANGGTGLTSLTANRIPYGNGTSAFGNSASLQFDGTRLGVGLTPTANTYNIQSSSGINAATSIVAQGTLQSYTGAGIFMSYESTYGRIEAYDYAASAWKNISISANGGNVGMGTNSPAKKLQVTDSSGDVLRLQRSGAFTGLWDIKIGSTVTGDFTITNAENSVNPFVIEKSASNGNAIYIKDSGNVGFGTTSPAYAADIRLSSSNGLRVGSNSNSFGTLVQWDNASGIGRVTTLGGYPLDLGTNSGTAFRIGTSGQLGIGGATYGSAGQVLTSQGSGSAPTWAAAGGGSWVYLSTVTASNSATIDVENAFDSTYACYAIVMNDIRPSSQNQQFWVRLKISGSYYSGGSQKGHLMDSNNLSSGYSGYAFDGNELPIGRYLGSTTDRSYSGILYLPNPSSTVFSKKIYGQYEQLGFDGGTTASAMGTFGGVLQNQTGACTGVRFLMGGSNISTGSFYLYGIKAS
jgi:hypothetical protein